jgi:hypothetical protein
VNDFFFVGYGTHEKESIYLRLLKHISISDHTRLDLFEIVVVVIVQSVFRLEMHQNNIFYFLKIIFNISTSKQYKNIKNNIFNKKNLKT